MKSRARARRAAPAPRRAEHTTPSSPHAAARRASRSACCVAVPATPISRRSASARLVSTVTAISSGGGRPCAAAASSTASRAAAIIARPPSACTFSIHTPSRVAAVQACATVFGMSWNLRSRNTPKPRCDHPAHGLRPGDDEQLLADLERARAGSSRSASASACIGFGEIERDDDLSGSRHRRHVTRASLGLSVRRGE